MNGPLAEDREVRESLLTELRDMWDRATPDSIAVDLERARALASAAPPQDRELARMYVAALERLERWLHDL